MIDLVAAVRVGVITPDEADRMRAAVRLTEDGVPVFDEAALCWVGRLALSKLKTWIAAVGRCGR